MNGPKYIDPSKIGKRTKCEICENNFVDCEDPNLPVKNPCGCIFHEYCLDNYGGRGSYCPGSCQRIGSSTSRSKSSGCKECRDLRREIEQLTSKIAKLNKKVEELPNLRKENKMLASKVLKLEKKIADAIEALAS